jgi:hypothetical protein
LSWNLIEGGDGGVEFWGRALKSASGGEVGELLALPSGEYQPDGV